MVKVEKHIESVECCACHVKVDYSEGKTSMGWIASGNTHFPDGHTAESRCEGSAG